MSTIAPTVLNNNGNVTSTAGAFVTALSSQSGGVSVPLVSTNKFDVYPVIMGVLAITVGATAPTAMSVSFATTAGTPIQSASIAVASLVATTTVHIPFFLVGALASNLFVGAGVTPLIQTNATTNSVTILQTGSYAIFQLVPGVE